MPKKRYEVSCTIQELKGEEDEVNEDGYDGDLTYVITLDDDQSPTRALMDVLIPLPVTSDFCT